LSERNNCKDVVVKVKRIKMFQINAVLNASVLDDVLTGLEDEGVHGITVSNVLGKGCQSKHEDGLTEKIMIKVVVTGVENKEIAMEAIRANAQDTEHGAGKMWVMPVLEVERIRTGEKDQEALTHTPSEEVSHMIDLEVFSEADTPAS